MERALRMLSALAFILLQPWPAAAANPVQESAPVPNSEFLYLYVNKSKLQAELRTLPPYGKEASRLLMNYQVAIGKQDGDKQVQGDNRTPEGIYFAKAHIDGKSLPARYGPLAIPIDFPNPIDRHHKKTGYGIWLHGVEDNGRISEAKVTEGCVAFYNEDIQDISHFLSPDQAVVVIEKEGEVQDPAVMRGLHDATTQWIAAWRNRDADAYAAFYGDAFRFRGMDAKAYKKYKAGIFAGYRNMKVDMSDIRIIAHSKYAVSFMNQSFNGDNRFVSNGRKILYWARDADSKWRIVAEIFSESPFAPTKIDVTKIVSRKRSAAVKSGTAL